MVNQIFKNPVPTRILFDLLDKICLKTDKYYHLDMNAYRKLLFHNYHTTFCETIKEYYFLGKQFYVTREITYKSFTNIIRQICKRNVILYTSLMRYNESNYNIDFCIYHGES
jgi:hypothetical protein